MRYYFLVAVFIFGFLAESTTRAAAETGLLAGGEIGIGAVSLKKISEFDGAKLLPKWDAGVMVSKIDQASPAEKAGLEENDIITQIGDTRIATQEDLAKFLSSAKADVEYPIVYFRFQGIHLGMTEEELSALIRADKGTMKVVTIPKKGTSAKQKEMIKEMKHDKDAKYIDLHYVLPDLDDTGAQRTNTTTTSTPSVSPITGFQRVDTKTTTELLWDKAHAYAKVVGERVTALYSFDGPSLSANDHEILIDRELWKKTTGKIKIAGTEAPAKKVADAKFLTPWVNDAMMQQPAFAKSAGPAFLGVFVKDFKQEVMLPREGAEVVFVYPNSPAALAGIEEGDVVTKWADQPIKSKEDLSKILGLGPGGQGTIEIMRKGEFAYKADATKMILANRSEFAVNVATGAADDTRQLIEDGELARLADIDSLNDLIAGKSGAIGDADKVLFWKELMAKAMKAKGSYLPAISASAGSIGEFRHDGVPLTAHLLQKVGKNEAILSVPNEGEGETLLWWTEDVSKLAVNAPVKLEGIWMISGTHAQPDSAGHKGTIFTLEKVSAEVVFKGAAAGTGVIAEPRDAKAKSTVGI